MIYVMPKPSQSCNRDRARAQNECALINIAN